jgi:hypothetical protein
MVSIWFFSSLLEGWAGMSAPPDRAEAPLSLSPPLSPAEASSIGALPPPLMRTGSHER